MGSKSRIAKYIVPIIQKHIDENGITTYIEPFVGGANVIDKIECKEKIGTDYEKTKNGLRLRNYYQEAKSNILEQAPSIKDVKFDYSDYKDYVYLCNCLIYVDPPYQGTKQYANATKFDYDKFWNIMREWSKDNIVLISEQNAPDDFECIWEQEVSRSIKAADKSKSTEKLFRHVPETA